MIGKYQIQLGADQITSGMASSAYATDGALDVSCYGLNPFVVPGVMYGMGAYTNTSTNVVTGMVASCEDPNGTVPNNRFFVDGAAGAANYYTLAGTTVTKRTTGTATYAPGISDLVAFDTKIWGTTASKLTQWDGVTTINESYASLSDTNALHPMLIFQSLLWIADGNSLTTLAANGSGTATPTTGVLTLSSKEKIVALGIDPVTGLMMISIETVYVNDDTVPSLKGVYLYDGISSKPTRKILVDDLITAFTNVEGNVFVGAGLTLGQWNGNGVTFLRKLQNATFATTDLPYKHHFANTRNILHVIDGNNILSYGAVVAGGKKGFFYTASTGGPSTSAHATCIAPTSSYTISVASNDSTNKLLAWDYTSTATPTSGTVRFNFNNIYLPRPIYVRRIRVFTTGIVTNSNAGSIAFTSEKAVSYVTATPNFTVTAAQTPRYLFDYDFTNAKIQGMGLATIIDTVAWGFVRFVIYYDIAE